MTPGTLAPDGPVDRKAVLFCPACAHEAPLDGEWSLPARDSVDRNRTDVTCPGCGHVVVSQPRFPAGDDRPAGVVRPVLRLIDSVVRHHGL